MRDVRLHEQVAFLAFSLLAGCSCGSVKVQLADRFDDEHRGTDLFLIKETNGRRKRLRIDLTEGHREVIAKKFKRNLQLAKHRRGYWVWVVPVLREEVITAGTDPCFSKTWDRVVSAVYEPVAFTPQDLCPEHGEGCSLVEKLFTIGRGLIMSLPKDYQALFE
ncbi:hypothetical protein COT70_02230 [candidate division WWE3 bacterium CG09_land_8_20_14_0_10_47_33]|uniref:Uncharacterized protein n=1 Tax=candidate division WWE3 bacterium CG_4_9_14_0_2_um_filter_48_10 TaxID=1975078 RepID=A0A2M8EK20_UNCKA|nr:MAG: hypothetical protein COT70_02230 [candidate division WWE3 bacterium CG09_land_8_20_14_0_10_47_33]PIZ41059.1 MAG: hypothetical protein COY35_01140 [candidate division WWE3 bacterium CG_4_10_14_0_2_um_filter_47_8]PJC23091.1 MAG: hypothetical protein CO059_00590 [candidate division WWE3 bacterium CG_4_9_14_0_2_um_filter_48_10]PJE51934.1 MAG: hypothetical protein COV28_01315 [candidate division WWE3 bacterium CG10_big_fil_rev_8_21_14_0_10_48_23]